MGQAYLFANFTRRAVLLPGDHVDTDYKLLTALQNLPGTLYSLLTTVGHQTGGTAELPERPRPKFPKTKYDKLVKTYVGRWAGEACCVLGEYASAMPVKLLSRELAADYEVWRKVQLRAEVQQHRIFHFAGRTFADITPDMQRLAEYSGLLITVPRDAVEVFEFLHRRLRRVMTRCWTARRRTTDMRWIQPREMEAILRMSKSRTHMEQLKRMLSMCDLAEDSRRVLEYFVSMDMPHYGRVVTSRTRSGRVRREVLTDDSLAAALGVAGRYDVDWDRLIALLGESTETPTKQSDQVFRRLALTDDQHKPVKSKSS